jgi:hypothetical protein
LSMPPYFLIVGKVIGKVLLRTPLPLYCSSSYVCNYNTDSSGISRCVFGFLPCLLLPCMRAVHASGHFFLNFLPGRGGGEKIRPDAAAGEVQNSNALIFSRISKYSFIVY